MTGGRTNIIVNLQVEGIHNWPDAKKIFPDVAFLSDPHRHMFHICCKKQVHHDDRDIEIIRFKRALTDYLHTKYYKHATHGQNVYTGCLQFGAMSCEMLARELMEKFDIIRNKVKTKIEPKVKNNFFIYN